MIRPVILSGGSGTRLWPLSRELYPKQLLPLVGERTLLQDTVGRLNRLGGAAAPIVVCNEEHRFLVAEQLRQVDVVPASIILEPEGRNTAPALTLAALAAAESDPAEIMLVMPADHVIRKLDAFSEAVVHARAFAEAGHVVTFGIVPSGPETGYGYLRRGAPRGEDGAVNVLEGFVEKPDQATAERYLASSEYLWNSGMFMLRADVWLEAIATYRPDIAAACEQAFRGGKPDFDFFRTDAEAFRASPSDSIDYAVMERLVVDPNAAAPATVVPLDADWSDVGAWSALWELGEKDVEGNVTRGDVFTYATRNSMLLADRRMVAALGVDDLIVVETADAVMVAHRDRAQDVKQAVEWLKRNRREESRSHRRVYRPWGTYESLNFGERYQVKCITVNPGCALSLQMHHHRAEHWVVVRGTAKVTRGDEQFLVSENESTFIPLGTAHRLENPGFIPLEIIEVQSGAYLGEDDIVRFDDQYGRAN